MAEPVEPRDTSSEEDGTRIPCAQGQDQSRSPTQSFIDLDPARSRTPSTRDQEQRRSQTLSTREHDLELSRTASSSELQENRF